MIRTSLRATAFILLLISTFTHVYSQSKAISDTTFQGIKIRNIGPAFMSGRIADIAIHPEHENTWYVAVGSGGVWKTKNAGVTWKPIFDSEVSYSIGCITIDHLNPNRIWVGSGENVGGRHIGYGDGIYLSQDGGAKWKNMGLKESQHISKIVVHPENSDVIWVAAQGPLWNKGGERGIYKSSDGGETWKRTLGDDEWIGATDLLIDPRDPNVLYAATWQRHRNVAAYMGGGPGSGIHKSEDGGESWTKLSKGLPGSNMAKIGLAISPQDPDIIYAAIELERRKGGVYRSVDRGISWEKRSDAVAGGTGPHYYQELYASPHKSGRIYLADVVMKVSEDGGKTFRPLETKYKHVDNHALVFKKSDSGFLLSGTDGGLYESFDLGKNWRYIPNLPITQFYKVALDDSEPFYFVYGGTQDNSTQGGPSRTDASRGIENEDWFLTLGGDGHQPATEPGNPDIMYSQSQQGYLHRIDRTSGEIILIRPQPAEDDPNDRYNWDAPILVSPHSPTRLYFASQRVWKSDNRGDSWEAISGDLTRNQERITLPIMGQTQGWDEAWDMYAMSKYNTITSLSESPLVEGLIYAGTDDGIIQVTEDGGTNWRKIEVKELPGVPATAFVNDIKADLHDENTVYVVLDNHKYGDLEPYILKSTDRGRRWQSLRSNLPGRMLLWRMVQDHVNPELMFLATEFGIYFSLDAGAAWYKFLGDMPTISFRDLAIQKRENDLVGASFGRGFFILDDYSFLREVSTQELAKEAKLFSTRKAWWYFPQFGTSRMSMGADHYVAPNPPFGAVLTYYLSDDIKTLKELRKEKEKELKKEGKALTFPGWDKVERERLQEKPKIVLEIKDGQGQVVRRINGPVKKGFHRIAWDLRYPSQQVVTIAEPEAPEPGEISAGLMVAPGTYTATMYKLVDGVQTTLDGPINIEVERLRQGALEGADPTEIVAFWQEVDQLRGEASATSRELTQTLLKVGAMQRAATMTNTSSTDLAEKIYALKAKLNAMEVDLKGNGAKREVGEKTKTTIMARIYVAGGGTFRSTYGPTPVHQQALQIARNQHDAIRSQLEQVVGEEIPGIIKELDQAGAPNIEGFLIED